jgi:hypothetical protein
MSALLDLIRQRKAELLGAAAPDPYLVARYKRLDAVATDDEIFQLFSMDELHQLWRSRHEDAIDLLA